MMETLYDALNKGNVTTRDILNVKMNADYIPEKPDVPVPCLLGLVSEEIKTDKSILQTETTEITDETDVTDAELEYDVVKLYNFKSKKHIILKTEDEVKKYFDDNIVNGIIINKNKYMKPYFKINILFNKNEKDSKMQNLTPTIANECITFIKKNFCADSKSDIRTLKRNKRTINKDGIEMEVFEYYFVIQDYISKPSDIYNIFCKIYKGCDRNGFTFSKVEYKKNVKILNYFDTSIYENDAVIDVINSILPKKDDIDVLYEYGKLEKTSLNNTLTQYIPTFILKDFKTLIDTTKQIKSEEELNADIVKEKSITIRECYDEKAVLYLDKNRHLIIDEFNRCNNDNPKDEKYDIVKMFDKLFDSLFVLDKENGEITNKDYQDVLYKPTLDNLNGRLYAVGCCAYINMPRFLRHTLARDIYVDFDIVNCYFVLLLNICIQNNLDIEQYNYIKDFVNNRQKYFDTFKNKSRDKIKCVFNCILMYDMFKDDGLSDIVRKLNHQVNNIRNLIVELPKYKEYKNIVAKLEKGNENTNSKILSRILQHHELDIIKCVMEYLKDEGFIIGSYCFDGLLIKKDDKLNDSILPKIKKYTFDKYGFDVDFVFKDMNEGLVLPRDYIYTPYKYVDVQDEVDACDRFIKDNRHRLNGVLGNNGVVERYYKMNNIWVGGLKDVFISKITNDIMNLSYYKKRKKIDKTYEYCERFFDTEKVVNSVAKLIYKKDTYITDDFKDKLFASTLGKVCLNNGVYCFKEKVFKEYPVEDVYSTIKINYDLPPRNEEDIKTLKENMLLPIFKGDHEHLISSMERISRAVAGHIEDKIVLFNLGLRNSGKGTLEKLIKVAFGMYISTTNGNNFITKNNNSGDVAKSLSWLVQFQYKRLIIMNEIDADAKSVMNGILLKMVASGGDEIEARGNYQDEKQFQIQSTIMFNFNRAPAKIEPFDATETSVVIQNRAVFLRENEITDENRSYANVVNLNLKNEIRDDKRWRNAFFWFVVDCYRDTKPELTGTLLNDTEAFKASYRYGDDDDAIIRKYFQITNDEKDKVFSRDIVNHKDKYDDSKFLNRKELFQKFRVWGADFKKNVRIGSVTSSGYTRLKLIDPVIDEPTNISFIDDEDEDDEDEDVVVNVPVVKTPAKKRRSDPDE